MFSRLHTTDCDHYLNCELHSSYGHSVLSLDTEMYFACWAQVNVRKTVEWLDDKQKQKTEAIKLV